MKRLTAFLFSILSAHALAQGYPAKPVRVIVQYAPVGPGDALTRSLAAALTQSMGQPFVIDNRPGADGMIAGEACVRSTPDGYTLCGQDSYSISMNPVLRTKMTYDPLRDMAPVAHLGFLGSVLAVHASVPANSAAELFELARSRPGAIAYGSWGLSSAPHVFMEWLRNQKGVSFLEVPYKTAPLASQGLLGGQVQVSHFVSSMGVQMAKAGKVRILASVTPVRTQQLADVPTIKEAGIDLDMWVWFGLFAPAGTPREIVSRLNAEAAREFINNPAYRDKIFSAQAVDVLPPAGAAPEVFAAYLKTDRENMARVVRETGIKPE
jgi:tripartite-type tricarboxylate transporter receptor subunit TctC